MISNSAPQKVHIEARAAKLGLRNITVKTRNVATMEIDDEDRGAFDRIVSVEMMEHMKNYELLLQKVSQFLKPDGLLFIHIFTHARASYHFETEGAHNWMGRHFFTGGTQPPLPPLVLQPSIFFQIPALAAHCFHFTDSTASQGPCPATRCSRASSSIWFLTRRGL
jgi:cyclopropane fatty-acyl-phospholipid synthase-like methyltransferase